MNLKLQEYMNNLSSFSSALKAPPQVNVAVIRGFMNEEKVLMIRASSIGNAE